MRVHMRLFGHEVLHLETGEVVETQESSGIEGGSFGHFDFGFQMPETHSSEKYAEGKR